MTKKIQEIDYLTTEGGPIIFFDSNSSDSWNGIENSGKDYEKVCEFFDSNPNLDGGKINIGKNSAIAWEMTGGGAIEFFKLKENHFIGVRSWPTNSNDKTVNIKLAGYAKNEPQKLGTLNITSLFLVILWAVESGSCLQSLKNNTSNRPFKNLSMDTSGLVLKCKPGKYIFLHDEVKADFGYARRCHIHSL